ncbi:MAG TPA: hypothetical protein VK425_05425, partial [Acidimicrobiales bacterium]|nr:hypothetical protein [Acidimicrobiales bacterium]
MSGRLGAAAWAVGVLCLLTVMPATAQANRGSVPAPTAVVVTQRLQTTAHPAPGKWSVVAGPKLPA